MLPSLSNYHFSFALKYIYWVSVISRTRTLSPMVTTYLRWATDPADGP